MANIGRIYKAIAVMKRVAKGVKKGTHVFDLSTWSSFDDDHVHHISDADYARLGTIAAQLAHEAMTSSKRLELLREQFKIAHGVAPKEKVYKECGTAACFSGWLAVSKEAQDEGACAMVGGDMGFEGSGAERAIAKFLGITEDEADSLVYPYRYGCPEGEEIVAEDVLLKLYALLDKYDPKAMYNPDN